MKTLIILLTSVSISITSLNANPPALTKSDLIASYRKHFDASKIISEIRDEQFKNIQDLEPSEIDLSIPKKQESRYLAAQELLKDSYKLNPYNPDVIRDLAVSHMEINNDLSEAIRLLTEAIEIVPNKEDILQARANLALQTNQFELAAKDIETLKKIGSSHYKVLSKTLLTLKPN